MPAPFRLACFAALAGACLSQTAPAPRLQCQQTFAASIQAINASLVLQTSELAPLLQATAAYVTQNYSDAAFAALPPIVTSLLLQPAASSADVVGDISVKYQLRAAAENFADCVALAPWTGALSITTSEPLPFSSPGDAYLVAKLDQFADAFYDVDFASELHSPAFLGFFEDRLKALSFPAMRKLLWQTVRKSPEFFGPTPLLLLDFSADAHLSYMSKLDEASRCNEAAAYRDQTLSLADEFFKVGEPAAEEAGVELEILVEDTFAREPWGPFHGGLVSCR